MLVGSRNSKNRERTSIGTYGVLVLMVLVSPAAILARDLDRSVYRLSPAIDASVTAAAGAANFVPHALESKIIEPRCPCDPNEVNALDRHVIGNNNHFLDSVSNVSEGLAIAVPVLLDAIDVGPSLVLVEDMTVYFEAIAVSGALTTLAKFTVERPVPRVYAGQDEELARSPDGYRSFYSGHVSNSFAALTAASITYNLRHPSTIWPWVITGVFGTSVAIERVAAGRHFYTDVIAAALVGTGVGLLVPWLHRRNIDSNHKGAAERASLAPYQDGLRFAVSLGL
ncbi:phosphatase PAP2 family protein [bacterium]|nr:phosphatase PAP2 family protein [bacterium]